MAASARWLRPIALAIAPTAVVVSPAAADPVDEYIRAEMARRKVPGLAAIVRQNLAELKRVLGKRLAELRSFTYISADARPPGVARLGMPVSTLLHYEMITASETRYYTFWLTSDGRVADFISYRTESPQTETTRFSCPRWCG